MLLYFYVSQTIDAYLCDVNEVENTVICVKVLSQYGGEVNFKIKRSSKFARIQDSSCQKMTILKPYNVRFVYDGQRISPCHRLEDLGMENGDVSYK